MSNNPRIAREGLLMCLCGPSGGGKTTFGDRLLADNKSTLGVSVSVTSRAPRPGEQEGKSYHFVSRAEFEEMATRGEFFEWEEIHGNLYGTRKSNVDTALREGKDLLLIIDIRGVLNVKKHFPLNTSITFIAPPSFAILKKRLEGRGGSSPDELSRRYKTAEQEYRLLLDAANTPGVVDYFVINDELEATYQEVASILKAERSRLSRFLKSDLARLCSVS